jgi:hypothetical protein
MFWQAKMQAGLLVSACPWTVDTQPARDTISHSSPRNRTWTSKLAIYLV